MNMKRMPRGTYLGGQQIAAVVGMHPYMSIGDVWAHCALGRSPGLDGGDDDPSKPNVLRRGRICEEGVIAYVEQTCLKLPPGTLKRDVFVIDPDVPFFAGTLDAAEVDDTGRIVHVHEVTVTSSRAVDAWGPDGDPGGAAKYKWIQNQHYQGISGATGGTVWLFVSDTGEIRRYPAERRNGAIESLRDDGEKFWLEHVIPRIPPPIECVGIGAWATAEKSIDAIYGVGDGGDMDPTPDLVAAANDYDDARRAFQEIEDRKRGAAAKVKNALGDHTSAKWNGGRVSWKRNKPGKATDHERAFTALAEKHGMTEADQSAFLDGHTTAKNGPRILRITISADKKEKED